MESFLGRFASRKSSLTVVRTALMGLIGFLPTKGIAIFPNVSECSQWSDWRGRLYSGGEEEDCSIVHCWSFMHSDCRSREYTCPVCKVKNIELLPDAEPGASTVKSKEETVILSFGYQKDQNESTSQQTSASSISSHICLS